MQRRAVRLVLLALLLVAGLGAGYLTWDVHAHLRHGLSVEHEVEARLDRMSDATASLGAAQQAYVAPGQQRGDALTQASLLIQQLYDDTAALRRVARSNEAAQSLLAFGEAVDVVVKVDDRAREHLRDDEELMAADLVYTEARQTIDAMRSRLSDLKSAESAFAETERGVLLGRAAEVFAGVGVIWLGSLLALARRPKRVEASTGGGVLHITEQASASDTSSVPPIDLQFAAKVCTELSRISNATALPPTLARAARALDAAGLIVWLGAGEELFPATAHGYGPYTLARLGPVPRAGDNATSAAWRTGAISTVPGGPDAKGAIVAPLFGPDGCFGVLAAEVRNGRETDQTAQAVASMIAAQLSTIVAPWPAPSHVEGAASHAEAPGDTGSLPTEHERTAASA